MEHMHEDNTNCSGWTWNSPQNLREGAGKIGNLWENWDHPDYSIVEIGQNTQKSLRDHKRHVVT